MMDEKRRKAAMRLLDAAYDYWKVCHEEGQFGAVQWVDWVSGELLIFTRGEYRQTLMQNIDLLPTQPLFGERVPVDGYDDDDA